jgi:hypothetical protein
VVWQHGELDTALVQLLSSGDTPVYPVSSYVERHITQLTLTLLKKLLRQVQKLRRGLNSVNGDSLDIIFKETMASLKISHDVK